MVSTMFFIDRVQRYKKGAMNYSWRRKKEKAGIAYGTRTRVARVKGGSPGPLDERDFEVCRDCGRE